MKWLGKLFVLILFFFLFNITNVYAEDPYLYCKYSNTNYINDYYELYIQFYNSNASTYDYEFSHSSGNPVNTKIAPNNKQDLIDLGMYNSSTDVVSCPALGMNDANELVLWSDESAKFLYQLIESECSFQGCKFGNMGAVVSDPAFVCNYESKKSNKKIKLERATDGADIYMTYPDGTSEVISSSMLLGESCDDFYLNLDTKKFLVGNSDIARHINQDDYYETSIHDFLCGTSGQSIEYFCANGVCNYPDNAKVNCGKWEERINPNEKNIALCEQSGVKKALKFIGNLLLIAKILVPIILIVMGSIDFSKAVMSSNPDALQKSIKMFITRILAGVAIFFLPTVVRFLFQGIMKNASHYQNCSTCIFTPSECDVEN